MGTWFLSFKQHEMFLGEHCHQSSGSGPASTSLTTSAESQEGKSSQGGHQSLSEATLTQKPSHLLMGHRTKLQNISRALPSSGKHLKFSGTNPRHFPAVIFFLLLKDTGVIPPGRGGGRGTTTQLQCCTKRWSQSQPGLPNFVPVWLEEPQ